MKRMGGKLGGALGVCRTWALTEEKAEDEDGVLGQLKLEREPSVLGRFTKPAALILGPRRERASTAPSECRTSWESVREARLRARYEEPSETAGLEGVEGDDGIEFGERRWRLLVSSSCSARRVREEVKTKAVVPFALELVLVFVDVVARMGLQSLRLMKVGGTAFVFSARESLELQKSGALDVSRDWGGR